MSKFFGFCECAKKASKCTSNLAVLCCKSLFQPFAYQANWLACIIGVRFSGERRQKPEAGANASENRVRRAIKGYVWGGMPKSNGMWTGRCFFCVFPVALVWRFSLTSRLPSLSCKNAKKITPVMQATNWLKAGPKRRIWSKGGVFFY